MGDFFSFLHSHTVGDPIAVGITISILKVSLVAFLLTIALDLMCWRTFLKVWRSKPKLYVQSAIMNVVNLILASVLGGPTASVVLLPESDHGRGLQQQADAMSEDLSAWQKASALQLSPPEKDVQQLFALGSVGRMLCHVFFFNLFFSVGHRLLHTRRLYWLHRFHHQWTEDVLPMATMANHPVDFLLTVCIPLAVASTVTQILLSPGVTPLELLVCATFEGGCAVLVHTPLLHELSEALPDWLCTTSFHLEHHRAPVLGNYSAPNISFDWLVAKVRGLPYRERKQQAKKKDKAV